MDMYEVIGTSTPENLLEDPRGAEKIAVALQPGNGVLKAGCLLYRLSSGLYAPATTSQLSTSYDLVVLADDVNTGADGALIAEDASAYRSGRFIDGKVFFKAGSTMTAAYKLVLRLMGIVMKVGAETTATVDNQIFTVTYIANNGADPAEPDYVVQEASGATHTVLANTVTDFTAPNGKQFSKWNTNADGSGTDKAAAATLTVEANVKLYAVWANAG